MVPKYLRDSIINFSISAPPAMDIFESLCQHRSPRRIRLNPVGIGNIGMLYDWSLRDYAIFMSRAWIRVRDTRQGYGEKFSLSEVEAREKEEELRSPQRDLGGYPLYPPLPRPWSFGDYDMENMRSFRLWKGG